MNKEAYEATQRLYGEHSELIHNGDCMTPPDEVIRYLAEHPDHPRLYNVFNAWCTEYVELSEQLWRDANTFAKALKEKEKL